MIKKLLVIASVSLCLNSFAQTTPFSLYYSFANTSSVTGVVDPTPTPTAVGVTSGSFTAVGLGANPTTTNVFAFQGFDNGTTPNLGKYFEVVLTPTGSYVVSLTNMSFYMGRSNTGAQTWCVRTNKDNYTANAVGSTSLILPTSTGSIITVNSNNEFNWGTIPTNSATASSAWRNNCQVTFASNCLNQTTPFNIRFYAYNAASTATTGSFRIDSVVVNGSATFSLGVGFNKVSHDLNAKIQLYPNPAVNGVANIKITDATATKVELINTLGRIISSRVIVKENDLQLDLTTLPVGTYFVRVETLQGVKTEKLIISK